MSMRSNSPLLARIVVAALVILLLGAAARGPAPAVTSVPDCSNPLQSGGDGSLYAAFPGMRFFQPVGTVGNFSEVDLDIQTSTFAGGVVSLELWDPATLAP